MEHVDPITLEPIPESRLLTIREGSITFHMDCDSLLEAVISSGKYINPLTTLPLPGDAIAWLREYRDSKKMFVRIANHNCGEFDIDRMVLLELDFFSKIGDVIVAAAVRMGSIMKVGTMMIALDDSDVSLYELDLDLPLGELACNRWVNLCILKRRGPSKGDLLKLKTFMSRYGRLERFHDALFGEYEG